MDGRLVAESMQSAVPDFKVAHQSESSASAVLLPPPNNHSSPSAGAAALEELLDLARNEYVLPLLSQTTAAAWFVFCEQNMYTWQSLLGAIGKLASKRYPTHSTEHLEQNERLFERVRVRVEQGARFLGGEPAVEQIATLLAMEASTHKLVIRLSQTTNEADIEERKLATTWLACSQVAAWMQMVLIEAALDPTRIQDATRALPLAIYSVCVATGRDASRQAAARRRWPLESEEWFDAVAEIINTDVNDLPLLFQTSENHSLSALPLE